MRYNVGRVSCQLPRSIFDPPRCFINAHAGISMTTPIFHIFYRLCPRRALYIIASITTTHASHVLLKSGLFYVTICQFSPPMNPAHALGRGRAGIDIDIHTTTITYNLSASVFVSAEPPAGISSAVW
jgi:hypothetical protein